MKHIIDWLFGWLMKSKDGSQTLLRKVAAQINMSAQMDNDVSSSRIQAYIILSAIMLAYATVGAIELTNAIIQWCHGNIYKISNEGIILISMLLAHHISVQFNRTKAKTPAEIAEDVANQKQDVENQEAGIEKQKDEMIKS